MKGEIKAELNQWSSPLKDIDNTLPYHIETEYFNQFNTRLASEIRLNNLLPLDRGLSVFEGVPAGYFDAFPNSVIAKVTHTRAQIQPKQRSIHISYLNTQLAIAAMLVAMITFGGYLSFVALPETPPTQLLSKVENRDIQEYLGRWADVSAQSLANDPLRELKLDNTDIIVYLNETGWD